MNKVTVRATSLIGENKYYEVPQFFRCGTMLYKVMQPNEIMTCDMMGKAHFCVENSITEIEYKSHKAISEELFQSTFIKHFKQLLPYAEQ